MAAMLLAYATVPAKAQLGGVLTASPLDTIGQVGETIGDVTDTTLQPLAAARRDVRKLARDRLRRLARHVSDNREAVEWDEHRQPAVRGEVLLLDPDPEALQIAGKAGYPVLEQNSIAGLGVPFVRLGVPAGRSLAHAIRELRKALPGRTISADNLHFPAGRVGASVKRKSNPGALPRGGTVGVIDGGIAGSDRLAAQHGFARGAPKSSEHASAIASLLAGAGTAHIYGADVYGSDPAGGSALAIAKALGWMAQQAVPVVSISLVGPDNPLLARTIAAARKKGIVVVAAVGNDGAAAPPAYPASYAGVIAVTGVDGANRVLIEAGRAKHLDYAAPGADMSALVPGKGRIELRGTSFAAPLVASRIAARRASLHSAAKALEAVDTEAVYPSRRTGRGVVCNICRSGL